MGKFKKSGVSLGEPLDEICKETAEGSGMFVREWSKATIKMDCNTWTPSFAFKPDASE